MSLFKTIRSSFDLLAELNAAPSPLYDSAANQKLEDQIDEALYGNKVFEDPNRIIQEPGIIRWPESTLAQLLLSAEISKRELEWQKKYRGESTAEALQKIITLDALKTLQQKHRDGELFSVLDDLITPTEQMFGIHATGSEERMHLATHEKFSDLDDCYDALEGALAEIINLTGFVQNPKNPAIREQPTYY